MKTNIVSILTVLGLLLPSVVFADDIAVCGESEGHSYYAYRNLVSEEKDSGWKEDGIKNGKFTLKITDNKLDILISDASGGLFSSKDDGGNVVLVGSGKDFVNVVAIYPTTSVVESYIFQTLRNGKAQAMWTHSKADTPITKVSSFVADCSFLNIGALKRQ
jgi:hypothetical protein